MTPFHSTAADHTSTRAMEEETLPAPQTQNQRETKTPWVFETNPPMVFPYCPAVGHSAMLEILPAEWHPGGSQCFGGESFSALQHLLSKKAKVPLDWAMLGMPIARPEGSSWCGPTVQGCSWPCVDAAVAPSPWRPSWEVLFWAGAWQGADRTELFPLDIAFEPFFSRSCVEDPFIYHVLCVCVCQNKQTKIS